MLHKKICLVGAAGVGKTSLVRNFVSNVFSEHYISTVGVRIERKQVTIADQTLNLLIWDVQGEEGMLKINSSFLNGAGGYLLVIDGSRPETATTAEQLCNRLSEQLTSVPVVAVINKIDLPVDREAVAEMVSAIECLPDVPIIETSAKSGAGVERAFLELGRSLLGLPAAT